VRAASAASAGTHLDLLALQLNGHLAVVIGGQEHSGADRLHPPVRGIDQQELFLDTHTAPGHHDSIRVCHGASSSSGPAMVLTATGEPSHLSPREVQILQAAADGHPTRVIAGELGLSPLTVQSRFARIRTRLHTGDQAHMVLLALRAGVIH
jgi:DNA-binding NarL/FixJ family response regulator